MKTIETLSRKWRDLAIEPPEDALEAPHPVPEGMRAWKNKGNEFVVVACHYSADPEKRSDEWYEEACKGLRPDQIERELEINFDSKAGAKAFPYLEYNSSVFRVDPPEPIPKHWKIIAGMDYGARNPTSFHWYAVDEYRRFWAFDEFYLPMNQLKGGLPEFARYVKNHRYYARLLYIAGDPKMFARDQNIITKETGQESFGTIMSIAELLMKEGIHKLQRGNNDRMAGLARVHQLFNWRGDPRGAKPALFIGRRCEKAWWELNNLVYLLDTKDTKNPEEDVVKKHDHFFDELKYATLSQDAPSEEVVNPRAGFATLKTVEEEIDRRLEEEKDPYAVSFDDEYDAFDALFD